MTLQNLISPRFTSIIFRSKSNRIAIVVILIPQWLRSPVSPPQPSPYKGAGAKAPLLGALHRGTRTVRTSAHIRGGWGGKPT